MPPSLSCGVSCVIRPGPRHRRPAVLSSAVLHDAQFGVFATCQWITSSMRGSAMRATISLIMQRRTRLRTSLLARQERRRRGKWVPSAIRSSRCRGVRPGPAWACSASISASRCGPRPAARSSAARVRRRPGDCRVDCIELPLRARCLEACRSSASSSCRRLFRSRRRRVARWRAAPPVRRSARSTLTTSRRPPRPRAASRRRCSRGEPWLIAAPLQW